jgi:hypothetical protein
MRAVMITGWIRVADRLPMEDGNYLVWGPGADREDAWWNGTARHWQLCTPHDYIEIAADSGEITHWTPLPEPPVGEGQ